jgi:hypothetical protein
MSGEDMEQGEEFEPLPGTKGFWVAEDIFLFLPPPDQELTEIPSIKNPGEISLGFNLHNLARAMGCQPEDIILNNKIGALTVTFTPSKPKIGFERAMDFVFEIPGYGAKAPVSITGRFGRA